MTRTAKSLIIIFTCVILIGISYSILSTKSQLTQEVAPQSIFTSEGHAYVTQVSSAHRPGFSIPSDDLSGIRSTLMMLEDGHPLGTPHSLHASIAAVGKGLFCHWSGWVYFSSSDNSDPRSNGRHYVLVAEQSPAPWLYWSLISLCLVAAFIGILAAIHLLSFWTSAYGVRSHPLTSAYRPEIDGLRAIAVTLVVMFHLGFTWIPAGYVGVDIFFVISGFLITVRIVGDLERRKFSFVDFYERRVLRILPALFAVILATLVASFFLLLPGDYTNLASAATYAALASSNLYFLMNTGYFDPQADLMPLLHTWSLGVEEQFYLVWPVLLWATYAVTRSRRWIASVLVLMALASLVSSVFQTATDPKAAFFLPSSRAWEFCAGAFAGLVALPAVWRTGRVKIAMGLIGLASLAVSAELFTPATPFPGLAALLPVIGTMLLVSPSLRGGGITALLSTRVAVFLGRMSYSLYLWHWPVITLFRHYNLGRPLSTMDAVVLLPVIVVLAVLSWRFIEEPLRRSEVPAKVSFATAALAACVVLVCAFGVRVSDGAIGRLPPSFVEYQSLPVMRHWTCPNPVDIPGLSPGTYCRFGADWDHAAIHGILIGDSHAEHFAPLLDIAAKEAGIALERPEWVCMPFMGVTSIKRNSLQLPAYNTTCGDLNAPLFQYIESHPELKVIVVANSWPNYTRELYRDGSQKPLSVAEGAKLIQDGVLEMAENLGVGKSRRMLVIASVPQRENLDLSCWTAGRLPLRATCPKEIYATPLDSPVLASAKLTDPFLKKLSAINNNIRVTIPSESQCDTNGCNLIVNGDYIYADTNHLRRNMSEETKRALVDLYQLEPALQDAVPLGDVAQGTMRR